MTLVPDVLSFSKGVMERGVYVLLLLVVQCLGTPELPAKGGWSLQMEIGGTCPTGTKTCFSDQTGVSSTFNRTGIPGTFSRGEECCPFGITPMLDCGTYVNIGQPYACCPLGNADCRGDVEDPLRQGNEVCANPGWALWQIPDGDFNMFCCLPGQYGYWFKGLGQDAFGMCSVSEVLPEDATPAVQFNNGDGSVSDSGIQLIPLPSPTPTPAPTCDTIHYGWSLQISSSTGCTEGSNICPSGGSCCPSSLNCGTVIGDAEVPVCCPEGNPDCRGDVEGLWPQLCADSSWALWHVNTNGNHFCCRPGKVGYNVPDHDLARGFCGNAVPQGFIGSILDYEGDNSVPGSFAIPPCNLDPVFSASWSLAASQSVEMPTPYPSTTFTPSTSISAASKLNSSVTSVNKPPSPIAVTSSTITHNTSRISLTVPLYLNTSASFSSVPESTPTSSKYAAFSSSTPAHVPTTPNSLISATLPHPTNPAKTEHVIHTVGDGSPVSAPSTISKAEDIKIAGGSNTPTHTRTKMEINFGTISEDAFTSLSTCSEAGGSNIPTPTGIRTELDLETTIVGVFTSKRPSLNASFAGAMGTGQVTLSPSATGSPDVLVSGGSKAKVAWMWICIAVLGFT